MHRLAVLAFAIFVVVTPARAQEPDAREIAQERASAEADAPKLADVLGQTGHGRG